MCSNYITSNGRMEKLCYAEQNSKIVKNMPFPSIVKCQMNECQMLNEVNLQLTNIPATIGFLANFFKCDEMCENGISHFICKT